MKLLTLTLFLFATSGVLADNYILYCCARTHSRTEFKNGPVVSDAFAEKLTKNMPAWSDHRFVAKKHPKLKDVVMVTCSAQAESKEKAVEAVAEQGRIVGEWVLKEGH
jgi:hypothetical protein